MLFVFVFLQPVMICCIISLKHTLLTDTGALPERHERAEDAVDELGSMLDGEASLQLQRPVVVHHPAERRHSSSDWVEQ